MSRITHEETRYIAQLARLRLDGDEVEEMARDLDGVLGYIAALDELDTSGIEPTAHAIALESPTRRDEADAGMDPELAVAGAPEAAGTAFLVPKVLDGEEG